MSDVFFLDLAALSIKKNPDTTGLEIQTDFQFNHFRPAT
jgi:hypothetical protein